MCVGMPRVGLRVGLCYDTLLELNGRFSANVKVIDIIQLCKMYTGVSLNDRFQNLWKRDSACRRGVTFLF